MTLILSGTDGLSDVDGSAATPAIRGTDANTGIFFPAADTIGFAEGGAEAMRIDSSGNLLVGTTTATSGYVLKVAGGGIYASDNHTFTSASNELNLCGAAQAAGDVYLNYRNSATTITTYRFYNGKTTGYAACVATSFTPSSDYRIKTDVQDESAALEKVLSLRPVNYIKDNASEREHGLIAHEVAELFPDLVGGEGKDAVDDEGDMVIQTVNYMGLTSILVKAIQEQQALITSLTARITALESN